MEIYKNSRVVRELKPTLICLIWFKNVFLADLLSFFFLIFRDFASRELWGSLVIPSHTVKGTFDKLSLKFEHRMNNKEA